MAGCSDAAVFLLDAPDDDPPASPRDLLCDWGLASFSPRRCLSLAALLGLLPSGVLWPEELGGRCFWLCDADADDGWRPVAADDRSCPPLVVAPAAAAAAAAA